MQHILLTQVEVYKKKMELCTSKRSIGVKLVFFFPRFECGANGFQMSQAQRWC